MAQRFKYIAKGALRVIAYQVVFAFVGLLITPMLLDASAAIRIPLVGLLIAVALVLMFIEGAYRGETDCAKADMLDRLIQKGNYNAANDERAARYSRMKGIASSALAAIPFVLIAGYVALTVKPYVYTLQDLPAWLSSYFQRAEIGDALLYARSPINTATVTDYLRFASRFLLFPFVSLMGEMSDEMSLLFDRLSPLFMLMIPAAAAIGYQFGPARRKKTVAMIEKAKNTPRKRLKKAVKQRTQKEKKQLI